MTTSSPKWLSDTYHNVWLPYTQMKNKFEPLLAIASSERCELIDVHGNHYIDAIASWWTVSHEHRHPHIIDSVIKQAQTLPHISLTGCASEITYKLAGRLAKLFPGDINRILFADSGSIAVEIAMKLAIQYYSNLGKYTNSEGLNTKTSFVYFDKAYHGETIATMSISDADGYQTRAFKGCLRDNFHIKLPRNEEDFIEFDKQLSRIHHKVAAVIIEPLLQAANGFVFHDASQLRKIYEIVKKYDILFIADEMVTALGRVGSMFAVNQADIVPDMVIVSKSLTGGTLPLVVTGVKDSVYEAFISDDLEKAFMHGTTFMGNPMGCAAANANLDIFEQEDVMLKVQNIERILKTSGLCELLNCPHVEAVSIHGAVAAIRFKKALSWSQLTAARVYGVKNNLWIRPFSNVLYTTPPFNVSEEQLLKTVQVMKDMTTGVLATEDVAASKYVSA